MNNNLQFCNMCHLIEMHSLMYYLIILFLSVKRVYIVIIIM